MKIRIGKLLSLLLAVVMLAGLLSAAAIPAAAAAACTEVGEVDAVTAECPAFTASAPGAQKAEYFVTSSTDQNVSITVENGRAYADEAHTRPITHAAEEQVVYIVADPAPEGKVFGYWTEKEVAVPGGDGWFGNYAAAQTTYTVYYSDVVLAPVYETLVDEIVINGMIKPTRGGVISDPYYSGKWGCSVPADSGYSLGYSYWYDITTGEAVSMSSGDVFQTNHTYRFKAKISLYGDTIFPANLRCGDAGGAGAVRAKKPPSGRPDGGWSW